MQRAMVEAVTKISLFLSGTNQVLKIGQLENSFNFREHTFEAIS